MSRRSSWLSFVAVLAVVGCSSTEPEPEPPNVQGEYAGTWTFSATREDGVVLFSGATCPCTFSIVSQTGSQFAGRTIVTDPCQGILPFSNGHVDVNGQIEFQFSVRFNLFGDGTGCGIASQPAFTGTYSSGTISAQRTEEYDCTPRDGFRYTVNVSVNVTRQ